MSKNKYSHQDKYRYKSIPSEWDDSLGNDFWIFFIFYFNYDKW